MESGKWKNVKKFSAIFWLSFLFVSNPPVSFAQEEDRRQIVVMKSTISDVERILGKPRTDINSTDVLSFFTVKSGGLTILYSTGLCKSDQRGGWNVEKGIVVRITYYPSVYPTLKSFKIDRKKYQKTFEGDTDHLSYINNEDGIKYIVLKNKVVAIVYFPARNFDRKRCGVINNIAN